MSVFNILREVVFEVMLFVCSASSRFLLGSARFCSANFKFSGFRFAKLAEQIKSICPSSFLVPAPFRVFSFLFSLHFSPFSFSFFSSLPRRSTSDHTTVSSKYRNNTEKSNPPEPAQSPEITREQASLVINKANGSKFNKPRLIN